MIVWWNIIAYFGYDRGEKFWEGQHYIALLGNTIDLDTPKSVLHSAKDGVLGRLQNLDIYGHKHLGKNTDSSALSEFALVKPKLLVFKALFVR